MAASCSVCVVGNGGGGNYLFTQCFRVVLSLQDRF